MREYSFEKILVLIVILILFCRTKRQIHPRICYGKLTSCSNLFLESFSLVFETLFSESGTGNVFDERTFKMDSRFEIGNVFTPAVLDKSGQKLAAEYMEKLRRIDSHALGFIPFSAYDEHIRRNRVIIETENDEPCGFMIWSKNKIRAKILMCCILEDFFMRQI